MFNLTLEKLLDVTRNVPDDMHEPDNYGVRAVVLGSKLDNAFGDGFTIPTVGEPELTVRLHQEMEFGSIRTREINLANIIALARLVKPLVNALNSVHSELVDGMAYEDRPEWFDLSDETRNEIEQTLNRVEEIS